MGVNSVIAGAARIETGSTFFLSFDSGSTGTLPDCGGFLVVLTASRFGKNAGFFTGASKAPQDYIEWLVLSDLDTWHVFGFPPQSLLAKRPRILAVFGEEVHVSVPQSPIMVFSVTCLWQLYFSRTAYVFALLLPPTSSFIP